MRHPDCVRVSVILPVPGVYGLSAGYQGVFHESGVYTGALVGVGIGRFADFGGGKTACSGPEEYDRSSKDSVAAYWDEVDALAGGAATASFALGPGARCSCALFNGPGTYESTIGGGIFAGAGFTVSAQGPRP